MAESGSHKFDAKPLDVPSQRVVDRAYRAWWGELCRVIERQFGSGPPDPEEAVQNAFEKFARLPDLAGVANPRAWLHTTSRNYVLDARRRAAVRAASQPTLEILSPPSEIDSEHVLAAREELARVEKAILAMEPRRREVLLLHSVHGLPYSKIAERLGISDARVRQLMASALALCAAAASPEESED